MNPFARNTFKYLVLPRIIPRCRNLLQEGFAPLAYLMAGVFRSSGLLPMQHPYCNPVNIGKFGVCHVLAQAAANLKFSKKHLDQIALFVLVLTGTALMMVQIGLLGFAAMVQVAHAAPDPMTLNFNQFFGSPNPAQDISYMILDRIFGIPGMFGSCVATNDACLNSTIRGGAFPYPYHQGLHDLLAFYSRGLLFVAVIIVLYHLLTMLADMAETGHVLGRHFNRGWAPLRLVIGLGLLFPVSYGLNAAQWIALYVTKYGSGLATNAWTFYVQDATAVVGGGTTNTLLGDGSKLISKPQYPVANDIIQFLAVAATCWVGYGDLYKDITISAYAIREDGGGGARSMRLEPFMNTYNNLYQIQQWYRNGDITIAIGERDADKYPSLKGNVRPYCGEIHIPTNRVADPGGNQFVDGMDEMTYRYLKELVSDPWYNLGTPAFTLEDVAYAVYDNVIRNDHNPPMQTRQELVNLVTGYNGVIKDIVDDAYDEMNTQPVMQRMWAQSTQNGWPSAAIWMTRIAQHNGNFIQTVFNIPTVTRYPEILEFIQAEKLKTSSNIPAENRFDPNLPPDKDGKPRAIQFANAKDEQISKAMNQTYVMFQDLIEDIIPPSSGNPIVDGITALFKRTGLWSLRENHDIHPLASMVGLGKALITNSVMVFGAGTAFGIASTLGKKTSTGFKGFTKSLGGMLVKIAYIGLTAGILLYYIVPFLPFIYFFFAVIGWAKTVFEAMVGLPLWALAHLHAGGQNREGFPPPQSMEGYYLLLDLFIRPILIVFGLIASVTIFAVLAKTLNETFDIVVSNLSGFNPNDVLNVPAGATGSQTYQRGPIDQLAFTLIYAVVLYMTGMGTFKMIDLMPQAILRWMNSHAEGFGSMLSHYQDPGHMLGSRIKSGVHGVGGNIGVIDPSRPPM